MSLNIKNERVHLLAKEAARVTGKTQTGAIEEALERLLRDYGADPAEARARAKVDLVLKIAAQFRAESERLGLPSMTTDDLYDPVTGLPQ
jgi:antitoxin VapB